MLQFENTVRIERPIEEVFAIAANPENLPKWNYYVIDVTPETDGPIKEGKRYHQTRRHDSQTLRIEAYKPDCLLVLDTVSGGYPQLSMELRFEAVGRSTVIHDAWRLETGKPAFLELLLRQKIRGAVAANLEKLKILLEKGSVSLPDGRLTSL